MMERLDSLDLERFQPPLQGMRDIVLVWKMITYSMFSVVGPSKVYHAVKAGKGRASALAVMRIDFLLRENIAAVLQQ